MKHYINQESYLLANTSKKAYLTIFSLSILLATAYTAQATTIDNQKILNDVNLCTSIAVHYIENGKYNSGDTEFLYMNFSLEEQKTRAKKFITDYEKSEITNNKGDCNIKVSYKL